MRENANFWYAYIHANILKALSKKCSCNILVVLSEQVTRKSCVPMIVKPDTWF